MKGWKWQGAGGNERAGRMLLIEGGGVRGNCGCGCLSSGWIDYSGRRERTSGRGAKVASTAAGTADVQMKPALAPLISGKPSKRDQQLIERNQEPRWIVFRERTQAKRSSRWPFGISRFSLFSTPTAPPPTAGCSRINASHVLCGATLSMDTASTCLRFSYLVIQFHTCRRCSLHYQVRVIIDGLVFSGIPVDI